MPAPTTASSPVVTSLTDAAFVEDACGTLLVVDGPVGTFVAVCALVADSTLVEVTVEPTTAVFEALAVEVTVLFKPTPAPPVGKIVPTEAAVPVTTGVVELRAAQILGGMEAKTIPGSCQLIGSNYTL